MSVCLNVVRTYNCYLLGLRPLERRTNCASYTISEDGALVDEPAHSKPIPNHRRDSSQAEMEAQAAREVV
jgi:hypothetical protein